MHADLRGRIIGEEVDSVVILGGLYSGLIQVSIVPDVDLARRGFMGVKEVKEILMYQLEKREIPARWWVVSRDWRRLHVGCAISIGPRKMPTRAYR